jgi:protein-tyrosine phosphatase
MFRSDALSWLTEHDAARISGLGIRTVVDLRSRDEFVEEPPSPFLVGPQILKAPLFDRTTTFASLRFGSDEPPPGQLNIEIAEQCGDAIAHAYETVASARFPVLFHCAAGKDRTGVLAALILGSVGVVDDDIISDYIRSDAAVEPTRRWAVVHHSRIAARIQHLPAWLLYADPQHMRVFLAHMNDSYGGIRPYLGAIGVSEHAFDLVHDRLFESA